MRRNSKQYYNIYYTALKTIVIILLLVMLLQCKFSTPFGSILDKFYFHLNLIENIDDFKGVVYSIHDNLYDKNPIIDLTLQKHGCPPNHEAIVLFHWPGNSKYRSDDIAIQSSHKKALKLLDDQYICAKRTKMEDQNCKKNCPITGITLTDGLNFNFVREPYKSPVIDLLIHPDFPCFNRWKQLSIINDDYFYILDHKSIQNDDLCKQDMTKQCEEPLQDFYNFQNVSFYSGEQFISENLDFDHEEVELLATARLKLLAETRIQMRDFAECRQFDKDKVTMAEIIIQQVIILFWVFQSLKCLTFLTLTLLELWNYNIMNHQLDSLKYSLGITCLLLVGNLFESKCLSDHALLDFLISDQFRKLHMIVRYYFNLGNHDCFLVRKLNAYFIETEKFLGGKSHSYEFIISVHFYIVTLLFGVFLGIIFIKPQSSSANNSKENKSFWQDQLKDNRVALFLKYKQNQISEHNSEDSGGSRKQLVEMQTI